MASPLERRRGAVRAAAVQELAADLDPLHAVIFDDVGGGVGLGPVGRQERARADDIDRRLGLGHHAALGRAEARRRNYLGLVEARAVELVAQMEDRRRRHAGADEIAQFFFTAIAADRFWRVA